MEPTPFKATLLVVIAALGVSLPPPDFLGSMLLGGFAAVLGAIWLDAASKRERLLAFAAGLLATVVVTIGHEEVLPEVTVQIKAVVAGLTGRYVVAFVLRGAKEIARRTRDIADIVLQKAGVDDDRD